MALCVKPVSNDVAHDGVKMMSREPVMMWELETDGVTNCYPSEL